MQGIFVNGQRPKSKKAVKEACLADATRVRVEATSLFGNEYDGPVDEMPIGPVVYFVGPDPYRKRSFYGQLRRLPDGTIKVA